MKKASLLCSISFAVALLLSAGSVFAQKSDYKIIVTTPGYGSIYRYDRQSFDTLFIKDFKVRHEVSICDQTESDGASKVAISIGEKQYQFRVCDESPVIRFTYDPNRRIFHPVGFNYIAKEEDVVVPPRFKGAKITELDEQWKKDIEKMIDDKSFLNDSTTLFVFEADIDENGIVNKLVEINGAQKQYSRVIMDKIFDAAVRGWEPATKNGIPCRTLAHIQIELGKN